MATSTSTAAIAAHLAAAGVPLTVSPEVLAGLLRAMVFVGMHREDIGGEHGAGVEDFLVEAWQRRWPAARHVRSRGAAKPGTGARS